MTSVDSAVRIRIADVSAHLTTRHSGVADWVIRYFGSWWNTESSDNAGPDADSHVTAEVNPNRVRELTETVNTASADTVLYARKKMRVTRTGDVITAYSENDTAYTVTNTTIEVVGADPTEVGSAACRLVREALRGLLTREGWILLHASAVADRDGRAYLALGGKGSGKTTTALQLTQATNAALLANDRVFARADSTGRVTVLPWPAAAAIGLGLLDAAGWYEHIAAHRHDLHPTTSHTIQTALANGHRNPILHQGRELKPQLYPDQITDLLGIPLATEGTAATLLFPSINPDSAPTLVPGGREITTDDTFAGREEDRYPNIFALRVPEPEAARTAVFDALNALPKLTVTLGHDPAANTALLKTIHQQQR
jgi:hypothetical protein